MFVMLQIYFFSSFFFHFDMKQKIKSNIVHKVVAFNFMFLFLSIFYFKYKIFVNLHLTREITKHRQMYRFQCKICIISGFYCMKIEIYVFFNVFLYTKANLQANRRRFNSSQLFRQTVFCYIILVPIEQCSKMYF